MRVHIGILSLLLSLSLPLSAFRPFNDDSETLVQALESNFQAYFQVELYKMVQFEKNGTLREAEAFLIYNYGSDSARGIWRILPSESFPGATLLSLQGPALDPPKLYLKEGGAESGGWVPGLSKQQSFGSTTWNLEDIYDDDKEDWNNTRGASTVVNGIFCNRINQTYKNPVLRRQSAYLRRSVYLSADENLFIQSDFYDRSDTLLKRLQGRNHLNLGTEETPRIRPRHLIMDHVQRGVFTIMTLTHYDYDLELEPRFFSPETIDAWNSLTDQALKDRLKPVAP